METLPQALRVYDEIRRPFAQDVQRRSMFLGHVYQLNALGWEDVTVEQSRSGGIPRERMKELSDQIPAHFKWVMEGSATVERDKALAMLEKL